MNLEWKYDYGAFGTSIVGSKIMYLHQVKSLRGIHCAHSNNSNWETVLSDFILYRVNQLLPTPCPHKTNTFRFLDNNSIEDALKGIWREIFLVESRAGGGSSSLLSFVTSSSVGNTYFSADLVLIVVLTQAFGSRFTLIFKLIVLFYNANIIPVC